MTFDHGIARPLTILAALAILACQGLKPHEDAAIDAWLNCDECLNGEREAVKAVGRPAVPRLTRALDDGPPSDRRTTMRAKFGVVFDRIEASNGPATLAVTRTEFVDRAERNYVAIYQKRAAIALRDIGGPDAQSALRVAAGRDSYRDDVQDVIRFAAVMSDTGQFQGTIRPAGAGYGDTVFVRAPAHEPFDGNELVAVDSAVCSIDDPPVDVTSDSLTFLLAGEQGRRVLFICNMGVTSRVDRAAIVIRTLSDANDRRTDSCADIACVATSAPDLLPGAAGSPGPVLAKLTLRNSRTIVDTVDYFRFAPATATTVQARLRWRSAANLDLRWSTCAGTDTGNTDGVTNNNPEETTQLVPAGACWLLHVRLRGQSVGVIPAVLEILQP